MRSRPRASIVDERPPGAREHGVVAAEDYALWLRVATFTDFAFVAEPLVSYRDDVANGIRGSEPADAQLLKQHILRSYIEWAPPFAPHALALRLESARGSAMSFMERVKRRVYSVVRRRHAW